jgi:hypothetical protein
MFLDNLQVMRKAGSDHDRAVMNAKVHAVASQDERHMGLPPGCAAPGFLGVNTPPSVSKHSLTTVTTETLRM